MWNLHKPALYHELTIHYIYRKAMAMFAKMSSSEKIYNSLATLTVYLVIQNESCMLNVIMN